LEIPVFVWKHPQHYFCKELQHNRKVFVFSYSATKFFRFSQKKRTKYSFLSGNVMEGNFYM
jgi:hypothetical protein